MAMKTTKARRLTLNPNSCKIKIALNFLRSLSKIKNKKPISPSAQEIQKRSHKIKIAAYSSMADAVGPRRAWSRALLFKLIQRRSANRRRLMRKIRSHTKNMKRVSQNRETVNQEEKLRGLVPGGKAMNFSCLLDETAHYIDCLATQVKIMQAIADHFSEKSNSSITKI